MSTLAGTGTSGFSGDNGPATQAQLSVPIGVSATPDGGFLIAEQGNQRIRRVLPNGMIITIAGNGGTGYTGDGGPATEATMSAPTAAVMTADGSVLFADANNNVIRRVAPDGIVSTVAGTGGAGFSGDNGPATAAQLSFPADVTVQADGGYLIADNDNNRIRRVAPNGTITTVAGSGSVGSGGDEGPATSAQLNDPTHVAVTADGGYLIADTNNNRIRRVTPDAVIHLAAGTGTPGFTGDGGPATAASLNQPQGLAATPGGGFIVSDRLNQRVRRVAPDGTITSVIGTGTAGFNGDGQPGTQTQLNSPFGVAVNAEGDYLVGDVTNHRIRLLDVAAPPPPPPPPAGPVEPASIVLDPTEATRTPGDPNAVTATVRNADGSAPVGAPIRFTIAGPNAGAGNTSTGPGGTAQIGWEGVREGTDTLTAFVDIDGDGTFDLGEPTATTTVTWALPVPVQGRVFNLEPVSGIVRIRVIRRGKGVRGAGSSFSRLEEAQQLPLTTEVDVTKGRVRMTLAADRRGNIQKGEFYDGVYQTRQPRTGTRPITELRLSQALSCRANRRSRVTASGGRRSRRLWGNARGRFRTRGRHSTATVRGTIWLTRDTCNLTTTTVRQGVVTVRDFAKRKNVRVPRGRSYVARARRR